MFKSLLRLMNHKIINNRCCRLIGIYKKKSIIYISYADPVRRLPISEKFSYFMENHLDLLSPKDKQKLQYLLEEEVKNF